VDHADHNFAGWGDGIAGVEAATGSDGSLGASLISLHEIPTRRQGALYLMELHSHSSSFLFHVNGQVRAKHLALKAAGALLGVGGDDRVKPLFRNFFRFFEDLLRADFDTDIASLAPFLIDMNPGNLFLIPFTTLQNANLLSPFLEVLGPEIS
jgi:hypothetical protein